MVMLGEGHGRGQRREERGRHGDQREGGGSGRFLKKTLDN